MAMEASAEAEPAQEREVRDLERPQPLDAHARTDLDGVHSHRRSDDASKLHNNPDALRDSSNSAQSSYTYMKRISPPARLQEPIV